MGGSMKALVAGGAGYIGSHTVYELIRAGHQVVVLDNLSSGNLANVHPDARFVWGDIRRQDDVARVLDAEAADGAPIDVALHFAAKLIVPESVSLPLAYYENNVEGLRAMLAALVAGGVRHVVFSSTAAVYGEPDAAAQGICREEDATRPINPYGETKLSCERMLYWVSAAHGLDYCALRYFNVAGADASGTIGLDKDQLTHLIPLVMQTALGLREKLFIFGDDYDTPDGTCIRDYVHVTDLAKAHVLAAKHLVAGGGSAVINLGSGTGYSVRQVVEEALKLFSVPYEYAPRRPGDPARLIADIRRARELLGWEPTCSLHTILESDYNFRKRLAHRGVHPKP
jgi:UDP-glucose 4-epimerase